MVTVAEKEKTGLEQLEEQATEFNELVSDVFMAISGCSNTDNLVRHLMTVYVAVSDLKNELQQFI